MIITILYIDVNVGGGAKSLILLTFCVSDFCDGWLGHQFTHLPLILFSARISSLKGYEGAPPTCQIHKEVFHNISNS